MNSRERIEVTLNHREPDRIPSDFGGTIVTGIHQKAYSNLRNFLKLPQKTIELTHLVAQTARVDQDVRKIFRADVQAASESSSQINRQPVNEADPNYLIYFDSWGVGWKMPKDGGWYFDMFHHPLGGNISKEDLKKFHWPDPVAPSRFDGLYEKAKHIYEVENEAVSIGPLCAGIVEMSARLLGFENSYKDFAMDLDLIEYLLDILVDLKIAYWEKALSIVGKYIHIIVETDDIAGQNNLLISPKTYRKVIKPRHAKLFNYIKSHSPAKVMLHSCGAVKQIIPDFIESGVDILNPVQVGATDMNSSELKHEFGKEIVFWGGAADPQGVLGNGSVQQVKDEVKRRIEDFAPGGGYVFAGVHNIQGNVPPENIFAMWETLEEYGIYEKVK